MKKISEFLRNVCSYMRENPTEIIFGAYLFLIMKISIDYADYHVGWFIIILLIYSVFLIIKRSHHWIVNFSFVPPSDFSSKKKLQVFCVAWGITFVVLLFCFIGFYPGSFIDSISQYKQVINGTYDDWHPVWHTLLLFFLPLKLTGGWSGSVVLFQMIYFSLLMGYMTVLIYIYSGLVYACISVAFILLNPFTLQIVMCPTKDVAFAMVSALCMLYAVNIYFTNGKWCDKRYRIVLLAFMLASVTLFRHNGILFSLFLLFALFFNMPRKSWRMLNETTCIIFVCIKCFLYWFLNVGVPSGRIMETTGLPLSIIVNVAKECPERLDERTSDFVSDLMVKQPNWKVRHNISGINTVKMDDKFKELAINESAIENAGVCCILQMMCHCFRVAPKQSFEAFVGLTIPVYGLEITGGVGVGVDENDIGLAYNGVEDIVSWVEGYCRSVYGTPLRFIFTIGFTILIMLAFILFKSNFRSFEDWKRIFLCFPIFTYNFGTMLLLSGHDVRFFYVSFLICPLVVLIMGGKRVEC